MKKLVGSSALHFGSFQGSQSQTRPPVAEQGSTGGAGTIVRCKTRSSSDWLTIGDRKRVSGYNLGESSEDDESGNQKAQNSNQDKNIK